MFYAFCIILHYHQSLKQEKVKTVRLNRIHASKKNLLEQTFSSEMEVKSFPANTYLLKVSNRNTRKSCEIS